MSFASYALIICYTISLLLTECQGYGGGGGRRKIDPRFVGGGGLVATDNPHFIDSGIQSAVLAASDIIHIQGPSFFDEGASYEVSAQPLRIADLAYYCTAKNAVAPGSNCTEIAWNVTMKRWQGVDCELIKRPICSNEIFKSDERPYIRHNGTRVDYLYWTCPAGLNCCVWECCTNENQGWKDTIAGIVMFTVFIIISTACRKIKKSKSAPVTNRPQLREVFSFPRLDANDIMSIAPSAEEESSPEETPPPSYKRAETPPPSYRKAFLACTAKRMQLREADECPVEANIICSTALQILDAAPPETPPPSYTAVTALPVTSSAVLDETINNANS